ncbi:ClpXP adapter SpxH family protein [Albibacterium bauzanense]|uniref:Putative DsbA family dithiol-disulfide isomerase n=1 Tax=Albibacterium bauzanense TaxID=653929 RepID=A0A4R1LPN8_9SPHI|nr:ClpXP adapter SpxH family protein [Albibacterium bauzanense]TCK80805.1 putative DsbA family dithiol-disulfide isomerase [Albibacterium bauzanense]
MNEEKNNALFCDIETGICEVPETQSINEATDISSKIKPVHVLYFTDPICSSCWGIEPQLRKLKLEYGEYFDIEYRMGGLLAGWNTYGGSDVSNPKDVAVHWEEAGAHYEMPIDGDVWIEDPLSSSYPPSIAFKAAQLQGNDKALDFLRRIKEMIFLEKKNIEKWENLEAAASQVGLDLEQFKVDFEGRGKEMFDQDLVLKGQLGVRGFPTIFFTDEDDNRFKVYGSKPYESYEQALLKLYPEAVKQAIDTDFENIFSHYPTLTSKEFGVLTSRSKDETEEFLNELYKQNKIGKYVSKNGVLWTVS